MKELDLILERYLEQACPVADPDFRAAFARLLEASDPELMDWLILGLPCPNPELAKIIAALLRCRP